jgi:hypothetical protein
VEQQVAAADRPPHRATVEDVGPARLRLERGEAFEARFVAKGDANVVARLDEFPDDMAADEPCGARYATLRHDSPPSCNFPA